MAGFSHQDLSAPRGSLFSSPESWKTEGCDARVRDVPPPASFPRDTALPRASLLLLMMLLHTGLGRPKARLPQEPPLTLLPHAGEILMGAGVCVGAGCWLGLLMLGPSMLQVLLDVACVLLNIASPSLSVP